MSYGLSLHQSKMSQPDRAPENVVKSAPECPGAFAGHSVVEVAKQLERRFPVPSTINPEITNHFWFTNEFPGSHLPEKQSLLETIKTLQTKHTCRSRKVSIITGESGILSCLPELLNISELIILIDHDPVILHFIKNILKHLVESNIYEDEYPDVIRSSLRSLERILKRTFDESEILCHADEYKKSMGSLHCFSSEDRLKKFQDAIGTSCFQPVNADYFSESDMEDLFRILKENGFEVSYFNISNAYEYYKTFYSMNPFKGSVRNIESTQFIRSMPLAHSALCAYSSLLLSERVTTCSKEVFFEEMHETNKSKALTRAFFLVESCTSKSRDIGKACIEMAKEMESGNLTIIANLRLILSHISQPDLESLSNNFEDIHTALKENKCIDLSDEVKFLAIIQAAIRELSE
ncbi:MAG: hypothetical protein ACR2PT_03860 [Endozoicomonas sp.]